MNFESISSLPKEVLEKFARDNNKSYINHTDLCRVITKLYADNDLLDANDANYLQYPYFDDIYMTNDNKLIKMASEYDINIDVYTTKFTLIRKLLDKGVINIPSVLSLEQIVLPNTSMQTFFELLINSKDYTLRSMIACGGYGCVFLVNPKDNIEHKYVIKIEESKDIYENEYLPYLEELKISTLTGKYNIYSYLIYNKYISAGLREIITSYYIYNTVAAPYCVLIEKFWWTKLTNDIIHNEYLHLFYPKYETLTKEKYFTVTLSPYGGKSINNRDVLDLTSSIKITNALNTIHSIGITHNDISGANILVDSSGNYRFIDFANASMFDINDMHENEAYNDYVINDYYTLSTYTYFNVYIDPINLIDNTAKFFQSIVRENTKDMMVYKDLVPNNLLKIYIRQALLVKYIYYKPKGYMPEYRINVPPEILILFRDINDI